MKISIILSHTVKLCALIVNLDLVVLLVAKLEVIYDLFKHRRIHNMKEFFAFMGTYFLGDRIPMMYFMGGIVYK